MKFQTFIVILAELQIVTLTSATDSPLSMEIMRGEASAKPIYQRTSTGPVAISEECPEGKCLILENTLSGRNRRDVNLHGWKLIRVVDGKHIYTYNFRHFNLKPGKRVKIFARESAAEAGLNDLVNRDEETWGVGSEVKTSLINERGDVKATHTQTKDSNSTPILNCDH